MYDIIIKNGRVIDSYNEIDKILDVAIENGKISNIGKLNYDESIQTIDATGCIVSPGLIDYHMHIYPLAEIGVLGEATCFPSGVTTAVDAGSTGCGTYEGHRGFVSSSKLRIKSYLNVCSAGLATGSYLENPNPKYYNRKKIAQMFDKYGDELVGLKIRQGSEIVGDLGLEPLKETIKIADEIGTKVMVHCSNPPSDLKEMIDLLRDGDILTHAFQNKGGSILDKNGHVCQPAWDARDRGVIFDVANANIHFSFDVANVALRENFIPDTISTDLTVRSLYKRHAVFNLIHVMAKYLNMGMSINQILEKCTSKPAEIMGMQNKIGCLSIGTNADISIIKIKDKEVLFSDREGVILKGNKIIKAMLTLKDGDIVYRDIEF